jgi:hypothetical protein
MLPGFRFFVAAVVLCFSMLVFGFGAIALLRSAREEFANLPVRQSAPPTVFAAQPAAETPPTLSMLRVEVPEIITVAADTAGAIPQDGPAPTAPPTPEPDRQASLSPALPAAEVAAAQPETVESIAPVETLAVPVATAPSPATADTRADEPATVAAIAPPPASDQPVSTLTEADTQIVSTTIATLGGPPVDIEPVPLPKAKPVVTTEKKKARAKDKPAKRRREARAEQPALAAPAAPVDAFGWQQPVITPAR